MKLANPFVLGQPLHHSKFAGHDAALNFTISRLGNQLRCSTSIVGVHFTGRTSFLRYLVSESAYEKYTELHSYVPVYLELLADESYDPQAFWFEMAQTAMNRCGDNRLRAQLSNFADKCYAKTPGMNELKELADGIGRAGKTLLLALDNFETLLSSPNFTPPCETQFFEIFRNVCQRWPRGFAAVVTTPRPVLDIWKHARGSWFNAVFVSRNIGRLTDAELDTLLDCMLRDTGVNFSPECKRELGRLSGNLPLYIQYFGELLFDAKASGLNDHEALAKVEVDLHRESNVHVQLTRTLLRYLKRDELSLLAKRIQYADTLTPDEEAQLARMTAEGTIPPLSLPHLVAEALAQESATNLLVTSEAHGADDFRKLSGDDFEQLVTAIKDAVSLQDLREVVRYKFNRRLADLVGSDNTGTVVFELVEWADRTNNLERLMTGIADRSPGNAALQKVVRRIRKA